LVEAKHQGTSNPYNIYICVCVCLGCKMM
jgi:hypothetical protein